MKVEIGKPIVRPAYKNKYKVVVAFMHGDADADSETEIFINKDNPALIPFLTFLDKLSEDDQGQETTWEKAPGYDKSIPFRHEGDCTTDYSENAVYEGYEISFFDENGVEHEVNVIN